MSAIDLTKNLKSLLHSPVFYTIMRLLLGAVFIFAGITKLLGPRTFADTISVYGILPEGLLLPLAIALPALELLAGTCLLFNIRGSVQVITGLLTIFLIVLGYAIFRDLHVDCGCFGNVEIPTQGNLKAAFTRDLGMMAISLYLISWRRFNWISRA